MASTISSSKALTKRPPPEDSALMPPPPPPKRLKRPPKVISEDIYTSALSHIIARDFFPGLLETETQQDYLNALDANDPQWIEEAERRVRAVMTPGRQGVRRGVSMTPNISLGDRRTPSKTPVGWKGSTPMRGASETPDPSGSGSLGQGDQQEKVDTTLSLSAFQAKYTSEDNESFNKVLDKQNATRRSKYPWLWNGNKIPTARQIAQAAQHQRLLKSREEQGKAATTSLIPRPSADQDARPAGITARPDYTNQGPRNGLMFSPDDLSDSHPQHTTIAQSAQERSNAPPKAVNYTNTRLPTSSSLEADATKDDIPTNPPSPTLSAIDAAIRGRPPPRRASTIATSSVAGSETPRVHGYAFVDETPTPDEEALYDRGVPIAEPTPQEKSANLLSELLRAGGSEGSEGSSGPNPFTIGESSRREKLHHSLVDKQSQAKRVPSNRLAALRDTGVAEATPGKTATPKFASSPRVLGKVGSATRAQGGLTPAAKSLYDRIGQEKKSSGKGKEESFGGTMDWTRTPTRVRRSTAHSTS